MIDLWTLRRALIRRLAGSATIVLNADITGTVTTDPRRYGLVANTTFTGPPPDTARDLLRRLWRVFVRWLRGW